MNDLYLILHKVRGEPAFDIAQPIMIGEEKGWIVPTSGHRAYPAWYIELGELIPRELIWGDDWELKDGPVSEVFHRIKLTDDWPDHYPTPTKAEVDAAAAIIEGLGLKPLAITRRTI